MPVQFFIEKHPVYIYASIYGLNFRAIRAPKVVIHGQNKPGKRMALGKKRDSLI